jgi:hypothetical protein
MTSSLATVSYIGATILFILSLGGLSNPETARRGNLFGIIGMTIAVLATVFGPRVTPAGYAWIIGALAVGGSIGLIAAKKVQMTQMPELVAAMHSLVGLAACLVGFASYVDTSTVFPTAAEKTIHEVEIYLGILIGAVTFSGSVIAFGKLSGKIGGKPLLLPAPLAQPGRFAGGDLVRSRVPQCARHRGRHVAADRDDRDRPAFRRTHGHGDRWRGHAGGRFHAQQLLRMGRGGHRLHAEQ